MASKKNHALRKLGRVATWVLIGVGVVLVALEFMLGRHGDVAAENLPLFPAIFGFIVFVGIVMGGILLRKLVMRGEEYYDDK